jgi:hypothetical protein
LYNEFKSDCSILLLLQIDVFRCLIIHFQYSIFALVALIFFLSDESS